MTVWTTPVSRNTLDSLPTLEMNCQLQTSMALTPCQGPLEFSKNEELTARREREAALLESRGHTSLAGPMES